MPLHTGSLKLYPVGTVNIVAIGSLKGLVNADSGSRGTVGAIARSLNLSCAHGVVDSAHRAYSYALPSFSPATCGHPKFAPALRMLTSSSVFGPCSDSYKVPSGPKSMPCGLR